MSAYPETSRSNERGFTLIEMLMAMLVMTVGLLGLLQSVQSAYRQILSDRVREEAVALAEEQMHDWRRLSFKNITGDTKLSSKGREIGGTKRDFKVTRKKEPPGPATPPTTKMTVSVSWEIEESTLRHSIYTLKTDKGE